MFQIWYYSIWKVVASLQLFKNVLHFWFVISCSSYYGIAFGIRYPENIVYSCCRCHQQQQKEEELNAFVKAWKLCYMLKWISITLQLNNRTTYKYDLCGASESSSTTRALLQQQQQQHFSTSFLVSCNKNMIFMSCVARVLIRLLLFSILSNYRMHCIPCNFKCKKCQTWHIDQIWEFGALTLSIQTMKNET